ncbi:MAG: radical SAM protein [Deferribacterota bacterium]|nr:radical SAM protein [Deferribacterota bacterium]
MKHKILPIFLPFIGCKKICIYCNQNNITGINESNLIKCVEEQLKKHLDLNIRWNEVAFYGGTFTALPLELQVQLLRIINNKLPKLSIRISTKPNCINKIILDTLQSYNVKTIELGIQSLSNDVLKNNNRDYTEYEVIQSINELKRYPFILGAQLMCGLFSEKKEDFIYTVDKLACQPIKYIRIYPLIVLKNTQLEEFYNKRLYKPLEFNDAIAYTAYSFIKFTKNNKIVIRMGLHITDSLKKSVVSGPLSEGFGDIVKIYILFMYLQRGNKISIGDYDKSLIYGYNKFLYNNFKPLIVIDNKKSKINWLTICQVLYHENNEWIFEKQKNNFAEKFLY